ncbi:hypothetical protein B0H11DRAFT_751656 [Mycena galericulata]|nr:hypothetical protein B0H11DRAFT_751656 [Mycena galericulata]
MKGFKGFQNIVSAVVGLSALGLANARVFSSSLIASSSVPSGSVTAPASASAVTGNGTTLSTTMNTSFPTATGGYVVTGVYTTCLTLTFSAPTPTASLASIQAPPSATLFSSSDATVPSAPSFPVSTASEAPQPSPSCVNPGGPIIPDPDYAIFTTCLVFLPTPSVTATATGTETSVGATSVPLSGISSISSTFPTSIISAPAVGL